MSLNDTVNGIGRFEIIQWTDAQTSSGWHDPKTLEIDKSELLVTCYGVLVKETTNFVVIAQGHGETADQDVCNVMTIPKGMIVKRKSVDLTKELD